MMNMMDWIDLIDFAVAIGGLMIVLMGHILTVISPYLEKWNRRFLKVKPIAAVMRMLSA